MTEPSPLASGTVVASRYKVLRELGRGGMGAVYVVEHVHTGDELALKVLLAHVGAQPHVVERFKREARASAKIKSDHVVKVTDADVAPELGGAPFLVMELLDGCDLDAVLTRRKKLPPEEVVGIFAQLARALDKSHAIGIVHRDLKPENVFLQRREDGTTIVKILDFGISKAMGQEAGDIKAASLTATGAVMGTPLYMSPEQARGHVDLIGPASDVWALGLLALHLLTGEIYWTAQTMADLMAQIVASEMPPPSRRWPVPPAFDAWFLKSCDRDPAKRWSTVGAQVAALAEALGQKGASLDAAVALPAIPSSARILVSAGVTPHDKTQHLAEAPPLPVEARSNAGAPAANRTTGSSRSPALVAVALIAAVAGMAAIGATVYKVTSHRPAEATPTAASSPSAVAPAPPDSAVSAPVTASATATAIAPSSAAPTATAASQQTGTSALATARVSPATKPVVRPVVSATSAVKTGPVRVNPEAP